MTLVVCHINLWLAVLWELDLAAKQATAFTTRRSRATEFLPRSRFAMRIMQLLNGWVSSVMLLCNGRILSRLMLQKDACRRQDGMGKLLPVLKHGSFPAGLDTRQF